MYIYFYQFYKRPLGTGLFNKFYEQGVIPIPPPGEDVFLLLDGLTFNLLNGDSFNLLGT